MFLLFAFHVVNTLIVVSKNTAPLVYDAYEYHHLAVSLYNNLTLSSIRPPFLSFLALPSFVLFGDSEKGFVLWVGVVSLLIAVLSVYALGKKLHSWQAGLLSAYMFASFPVIFGHARTPMVDLLLTGLVTLSMVLLADRETFLSLRSSILIGILIGLGMLTKVMYPLYLAGPFIYTIVRKRPALKTAVLHLGIVLFIALCISAIWYVPYGYRCFFEYSRHGEYPLDKNVLREIRVYFMKIIDSMGLLAFFVAPVLFFKKNNKGVPWMLFLALWIALPLLVLSPLHFKTHRYMMPLLPAVAVALSMLVMNIDKMLLRRWGIALIVLVGAAQTLLISYVPRAVAPFDFPDRYREWDYMNFGLTRSWQVDWKLAEISTLIGQASPVHDKKVICVRTRPVISDGLRTKEKGGRFSILVASTDLHAMEKPELRSEKGLLEKLDEATVVLYVKNAPGEFSRYDEMLERLFAQRIDAYTRFASLSLPDNSELTVYVKR